MTDTRTALETRIPYNHYYSSQIDDFVDVIQDNGNGTAWCYTGHDYLTLDIDKLRYATRTDLLR